MTGFLLGFPHKHLQSFQYFIPCYSSHPTDLENKHTPHLGPLALSADEALTLDSFCFLCSSPWRANDYYVIVQNSTEVALNIFVVITVKFVNI